MNYYSSHMKFIKYLKLAYFTSFRRKTRILVGQDEFHLTKNGSEGNSLLLLHEVDK
jgi:hypothetical protein